MGMFILSALVLSLVSIVVSRPTENVKRDIPLANVYYHCTQPNMVALTFDDGPYTWAKNVSDTLTAAGAKGTFFYRDCIYNSNEIANVQYVYSKGHQIASHTWSHPDMTSLTWDQINNEMWLIEREHLISHTTVKLYLTNFKRLYHVSLERPRLFSGPVPYGKYNNLVLQAAHVRGQDVVVWDFDSQDSTGASPAQQKQNYDNAIAQHPSNLLALNHEVHGKTETIPYAIQKLQAAGYRLVTVAECLGKNPYQSVGSPAPYDPSTWHC
ncbi:carbohydrate esterase family 4 protein [Amanita muscaria]